ncbi:segregation and condensation protein B [Crossiella equi]|uniref:Segregation and condensation protein B n=1 Tax=Crossiella equi TaxID=130796 RepID=A0ABS5ALJ9_9PSEU|nr:SMC-Scp complex subunit ScpB [Crossiella equi]MBP2477449.1 segregation and condensation protein B [Crossiella equi]
MTENDRGLPPVPRAEPGTEEETAGAPAAATEPAPEAVPELSVAAIDAADEEEDEDAVVRNPLPDLTEDSALESALEALLLVVDAPIAEEALADAVEVPVKRVTVTLRRMAEELTESGSGIDLRRVADGWRYYTRDTYAPFVERLLLNGQRAKLTRAALETLAVIAYRQPVTRARVAAVRGVNVDGVIRSLLARGLIEETGADPDTNGILYRTTELFLERLGLSSVKELPPLAPLLPEVDAIDELGQ